MTNPNQQNEAPERIWLQWYGDSDPEFESGEVSVADVTWEREQIFAHDIEYARVSPPAAPAEKSDIDLDPLEFWCDLAEVLGHSRPEKVNPVSLIAEIGERLNKAPAAPEERGSPSVAPTGETLKPCPWCGKVPDGKSRDGSTIWHTGTCRIAGIAWSPKEWNTRAAASVAVGEGDQPAKECVTCGHAENLENGRCMFRYIDAGEIASLFCGCRCVFSVERRHAATTQSSEVASAAAAEI